MITVLTGAILFLFCCLRILLNHRIRYSHLLVLTIFYFAVSAATPLLSALLLGFSPIYGVRFALEIGILFSLFYCSYYLMQNNLLTPRFVIYSVAILGIIAGFMILYSLVDVTSIRRLSALGGRNYIANSFAICSVAWIVVIYDLYQQNKKFRMAASVIILLFCFMILLLMGSRQAIIAFIIAIMIFNFAMFSKIKTLSYLTLLSITTAVILIILSYNLDLSGWYSRFDVTSIQEAAFVRLDLYERSVGDLTLFELLIGRPDLYEIWAVSDPVHPHNILLSITRYTGIITLLLFLVLFIGISLKSTHILKAYKKLKNIKVMNLGVYLFFLVALIYSLFSGNMTRIFSLYIFLGFALGIFDLSGRNIHLHFKRKK